MILHKKKTFLSLAIAGVIVFLSQCIGSKGGDDPRGPGYAGAATCIKCHKSINESYLQTAHYQSAQPASVSAIAGSFSIDSNSFVVNDSVKIVMEKRDATPYQVMYIHDKETQAQRFDIVFGNVKGQSYLYWKDDLLFQLPVSYFTDLHSWTSSPGYATGRINFDRPIGKRCFECHTSYIREASSQTPGNPHMNALDKNTLIQSIDCERCHGPAAEHVSFHIAHPGQKEAASIVSIRTLSRSQKIDMCAVCHSGTKNTLLRSTFTFKPGDSLNAYMQRVYTPYDRPDVHGNQSQLLAQSKCFIHSNLDCSTCHNTHMKDRGNDVKYAQHCQDCHTEGNHNFCKIADTSNISLVTGSCTKCHMPAQSSNAIVVRTSENNTNVACKVVNHRIAIYIEISKKIINDWKIEDRNKN